MMVICVRKIGFVFSLFLAAAVFFGPATENSRAQTPEPKPEELSQQVEIIRTAYGVPHIRAENMKAAGYALAWLQLEDYGPQTAMNVLGASGRSASRSLVRVSA